MSTDSSVLAWRIPVDRGAFVVYSPWGHKELDMTERLSTSTARLPLISSLLLHRAHFSCYKILTVAVIPLHCCLSVAPSVMKQQSAFSLHPCTKLIYP